MKKTLLFIFTMLFALTIGAQETVTDYLTPANFGFDDSSTAQFQSVSYTADSGTGYDAYVAGKINSTTGVFNISKTGYFMNSSSVGKIRKIAVTSFKVGSNSARVITIYGKNEPYVVDDGATEPTDWGDEIGTLTFTAGESGEVEIEGDYSYFFFNGTTSVALYTIDVTWELAGDEPSTGGTPLNTIPVSGAQEESFNSVTVYVDDGVLEIDFDNDYGYDETDIKVYKDGEEVGAGYDYGFDELYRNDYDSSPYGYVFYFKDTATGTKRYEFTEAGEYTVTFPSNFFMTAVDDSGNISYVDGFDVVITVTGKENPVVTVGDIIYDEQGVAYEVTSIDSPRTVSVAVQSKNDGFTEGALVIPSSFDYDDGNTYNVTATVNYAFQETSITSAYVPASITNLGTGMFQGCSALEAIEFEEGITTLGSSSVCYNCPKLTTVTLPEGLLNVVNGSFRSCTSLAEITLPSTIQVNDGIDGNAFRDCSALKDFTILATTPPEIGNKSFDGVTLANVTLHVPCDAVDAYLAYTNEDHDTNWSDFGTIEGINCGDEPMPEVGVDDIIYDEQGVAYEVTSIDSPRTVSVAVQSKNDGFMEGALVIPSSFEYDDGNTYNVTRMATNAFNGTNITSAYVPGTIIAWGSGSTFAYCHELKTVTLEEGPTELAGTMFRECIALEEITVPEGVAIVPSFFAYGCTALTTVNLPSTIADITESEEEGIGGSAFYNCTALKDFTILATTPPSIASRAFYDVTLANVTLHVPCESVDAYVGIEGDNTDWAGFGTIVGTDCGGDEPLPGDYTLTFDPADNKVVDKLDYLTISCEGGMVLNSEIGYNEVTLKVYDSEDTELAYAYDWYYLDNNQDGTTNDEGYYTSITIPLVDFTTFDHQTITEPGDYTVKLASDTPIHLANGELVEEITLHYTIPGAAEPADYTLTFTPAEGQVDELSKLTIACEGGMKHFNSAQADGAELRATVTDADGATLGYFDFWWGSVGDPFENNDDNCCISLTMSLYEDLSEWEVKTITEPGTYYVTIEAGDITFADGSVNEKIVLEYVIPEPKDYTLTFTPASGTVDYIKSLTIDCEGGISKFKGSTYELDGIFLYKDNAKTNYQVYGNWNGLHSVYGYTQDAEGNYTSVTLLVLDYDEWTQETVYAPGTYTITFPASTFTFSNGTVNEDEIVLTYVIEDKDADLYAELCTEIDGLRSSLTAAWDEIETEHADAMGELETDYDHIKTAIESLQTAVDNYYAAGTLSSNESTVETEIASIEADIANLLAEAERLVPTGITNVAADYAGKDVYTITGQKVTAPTAKGIYIVDGKKVYVK